MVKLSLSLLLLLSPLSTPVTAQSPPCCSWNMRDCQGGEWCSIQESNCASCGGDWITDEFSTSCTAQHESCQGTPDNEQGECCSGLACKHHSQWWQSCQPAPSNPSPVEPATPSPVAPTPSPVAPTDAPVVPPTGSPVVPPTEAPPTDAPVVPPPTDAPVAPTDSPVTNAPVVPPTDAPVVPPTDAPAVPPTDAPVVPPTEAPAVPPTDAPVVPPTDAPVIPPTEAPIAITDAPAVPPTDAPVVVPVTPAPVTPEPVAVTTPSPAVPPTLFSCTIPNQVDAFCVISDSDATVSAGWINNQKGLAVGGDLTDGSPNSWTALGGPSFVAGNLVGSTKWNWNGGLATGADGYLLGDFVDFDHLKYIAANAKSSDDNDNYKVVVVYNGGTFDMEDFFSGQPFYNDGYFLVIFNTSDDVTLKKSSSGKDIGFSVLAPFSKLTVESGVIALGFLIGHTVIDNSGGHHGKNYAGGISCGGGPVVTQHPVTPAPVMAPMTPAPVMVDPTPAPVVTPTPAPVASPTPAPVAPTTPAPIAPTSFPPGPYVTAATANEAIVIPDPTDPNLDDVPRTNCPHLDSGLIDWHDAATWGGGGVPMSGDVTLPVGARVIVRQSVVGTLGTVTVPSTSELLFDETDNGITFDAQGIDVLGKLVIGSETCRIETPVTITLHGNRPNDPVTNIPDPTYKGISVTGEISVHGKRFYRTWTRLALTVEPGDTVIMLQNKVNWEPGQEILLVTTAVKDSREWHRNEKAIVQYVVPNPVAGVGAAVVLQAPVSYQHVANSGYQGEVGLLTRTVKIQGNVASEPTDPDPLTCTYSNGERSLWGNDKGRPCPNTELTGFGGHIMVHGGGKGYVEGVELYRMGQTNVLGRYPMHFHILGDCPDCYFRDSSVHRSFYRCVSIHGTHYTQISENVAYDVTGYCYYLEDGIEHHNRIEFNLGAHIHALGPEPPWGYGQTITPYQQSNTLTLPADVTAAAFYVTNVQNYIIGNAASGGWAGFAFPNLPTPLGPHKDQNVRPSSAMGLTIDGNTAHSSAYWWYHAAAFYWGGSLYYQGNTLMYNAGRDQSNSRSTCLVNKCATGDCGGYCQPHERAWLQVSNSKAFLAPGVGFGSWSGRMEVLGYECHDCGLSLESLSGGFWINNLLSVCRTKTPLALPNGARASSMRADGFRWYDTNQEHIITEATFRGCGYRSDEYDQYNADPERGCGDEPDIGCSSSSSVWSMLTHSDQFVPEIMQGTRAIAFENCGRRFRLQDFRSNAPTSVSGREQNWYDHDGTITGFGERSVAASGLSDAGMWWQVDDETEYDAQAPLWFFKLNSGPQRGLGHFRMKWDDSLHSQVGGSQCGNGPGIPCDYIGYMKHVGEFFGSDAGLPVTANADVVGPVGGFAWKLELDGGAPKSLRFEQIEVDPATPLLLSIAYPIGTSFTIVAHAPWCTDSDSYSCEETFTQVNSIDEVRASLGNTYHVNDTNGVVTFRIIQTPKTYVGNPDWSIPQWNDIGKWGNGYAIDRFERDGVRLPIMAYGPWLTLDADCTGGVYCSSTPATYEPNVCSPGYTQTGYDTCTSTSNPSMKEYADGSTSS